LKNEGPRISWIGIFRSHSGNGKRRGVRCKNGSGGESGPIAEKSYLKLQVLRYCLEYPVESSVLQPAVVGLILEDSSFSWKKVSFSTLLEDSFYLPTPALDQCFRDVQKDGLNPAGYTLGNATAIVPAPKIPTLLSPFSLPSISSPWK